MSRPQPLHPWNHVPEPSSASGGGGGFTAAQKAYFEQVIREFHRKDEARRRRENKKNYKPCTCQQCLADAIAKNDTKEDDK
jgi:hypothetical protein